MREVSWGVGIGVGFSEFLMLGYGNIWLLSVLLPMYISQSL